jgi:predicted enzyme involved in methoxymalonyl-ACP biosynthesis
MEHAGEGNPASQLESEFGLQSVSLKDSVKLVIWDLDETLWSGTLSEGPVAVNPDCSNIVRQLNRRGIINSLCSKNDHEAVRARLIAEERNYGRSLSFLALRGYLKVLR